MLLGVYGVALACMLVTASVTAYVLAHPETGLTEVNPTLIDFVTAHGLAGGLLLVNLYNLGILMLPWGLVLLYRLLWKQGGWDPMLAGSLVYSVVVACGCYMLISWLLNVVHDVSCLLFNSCPHIITATWKLWDNATYLIPIIIAILLSLVYHLMRKGSKKDA